MSETFKSGHHVEHLTEEEEEKYLQDFPGHRSLGGVMKLQPGNHLLAKSFLKYADKVYNYPFRPDDVLVMTFPKCGTTWIQEVIWTMRNNPDLDNPLADILSTMQRVPFIEYDMLLDGVPDDHPVVSIFQELCPDKDPNDGRVLQLSEIFPEKRTVKTHIPFSFYDPKLLETCKVVFVSRNPYDTAISFFHHCKLLKETCYSNTLDEFINYFIKDYVIFAPYWKMINEVIEKQNHPNLHIIKYEEMLKNPLHEVQRLDKFIGTSLTEKQMQNVLDNTSFSAMKKREEIDVPKEIVNEEIRSKDGGFYRKGKSGGWKEVLTDNQKAKIEKWTKKNTIERIQNVVNF